VIKCNVIAGLVAGVVVLATPSAAPGLVSDRPADGFPDVNGTVYTITHRGSTIYVGGDFTTVTDSAGEHTRRHAAAVDASTGRVLPWNPRVNGIVRELVAARDGVYIGGNFSRVKGRPRASFARVSLGGRAVLARAISPSIDGSVKAIALSRRRVFIGGNFGFVNGAIRANLAAFKRSPRHGLTGWKPRVRGGSVLDLVRTRAGVFVGGAFTVLNGNGDAERLGLVTRGTGRRVRSFSPDIAHPILDIEVTARRVYAAMGGDVGGGVEAVSRADGRRLWDRRFDGDVNAVELLAGTVYAGGHFTTVCNTDAQDQQGDCSSGGQARARGASLTRRGTVTGWNPGANSNVGIRAFRIMRRERLVAGGGFTQLAGGSVNAERLALFRPN